MYYLADLLTLTRFILAAILLALTFLPNAHVESAFLIFLVAELTDTFDGTCARKWPFPPNRVPKYRRYAALYDMISDVLLAAAQVLFLTLHVNRIAGLIVIAFYAVVCTTIDFVVYGKLLGHPDNCTPHSLTRRNFPLARKIILGRRIVYALCLGVVNAILLFATNWPRAVKIAFFILGCSICVFAWFFLRQRRKHISRDAVELETKLSRKSQK